MAYNGDVFGRKIMEVLRSSLDSSINIVESHLQGFIEARYVRRQKEYFVAYLSSQSGCNRGCRMCHLTATKQTKFENVTLDEFDLQASKIFSEYAKTPRSEYVHWNFMARGEPLNNPVILHQSEYLFRMLGGWADKFDLYSKFNISTILPRDCNKSLVDMFKYITPTIYYSIYSVDSKFRKKWLPNALEVDDALSELKKYQNISKKIIKFHSAFIAGENDSPKSVLDTMHAIARKNIMGEFNIVRYNPFSEDQGQESEHLGSIKNIIKEFMPVKIITRVGSDVHASCGQFVGKDFYL